MNKGYMNYTVLSVSTGRTDGVFEQDYAIGLAAFGIMEMEKAHLIELKDKSILVKADLTHLPEELSCFAPLADAMIKEQKPKNPEMVPMGSFMEQVIADEIHPLTQAVLHQALQMGLCRIEESKGFLGSIRRKIKADPAARQNCLNEILTPCADPEKEKERLTTAEILFLNGTASYCFTKEERKSLKEAVHKAGSSKSAQVVQQTIDTLNADMAMYTTVLFSD